MGIRIIHTCDRCGVEHVERQGEPHPSKFFNHIDISTLPTTLTGKPKTVRQLWCNKCCYQCGLLELNPEVTAITDAIDAGYDSGEQGTCFGVSFGRRREE